MEDLLAILARKYATDKAGAHFYTQHYHRAFKDLRHKPIHLLEIGIGGEEDPEAGGASLRMWREYFPFGTICGLDLHPKNIVEDRIKIYQGHQADPLAIASILNDMGGKPFDIIIDDGGHANDDVVATFIMLFWHLASDGLYVVEDLQTAYWSDYSGNSTDFDNGLTSMAFFKKLIDGLNWQEFHRPGYRPTYFDRHIVGMTFFHNLLFIQKGSNSEGSNTVKDNRAPGH